MLSERMLKAYKLDSADDNKSSKRNTKHPKNNSQEPISKKSENPKPRQTKYRLKGYRSSTQLHTKIINKPLLGRNSSVIRFSPDSTLEPLKKSSPRYSNSKLLVPIGKLLKSRGIDFENTDRTQSIIKKIRRKYESAKREIKTSNKHLETLASTYDVDLDKIIKNSN